MLYIIGPLAVKVQPFNFDTVDATGDTDFAIKGVVGAEPPLEYVGEGGNELSMSGQLLPYEIGGLGELELLRQMRVSGRPQYVMRGDGQPLGWHAILNVRESSSYLAHNGVGKVIAVSINMRRAQAPPATSFFSLVARLVP